MTDPDAIDEVEITDPVALARLFVSGRSLKRGATIQLVRDLLALIESPTPIWREPPRPETTCVARIDNHIPLGVPNVGGYDLKSPIAVKRGLAGSVFLGPEANRYYTPAEAIALAGAIARATVL